MPPIFAHSVPGRPQAEWERLADHAACVAKGAAARAAVFGFGAWGEALGRGHDIGKCSSEFQAFITCPDAPRGPDHSTAGAKEMLEAYPGMAGRILAAIVAGHHSGLMDGQGLAARLEKTIPAYAGWQAEVGALPALADLARSRLKKPAPWRGFSEAFLVRMLFSCLVDADFVETEAFYARLAGRAPVRGGFASLDTLRPRLERFMAAMRAGAAASEVNRVRAEVLDHARAKAGEAPGLFTFCVPTGGGKTLASLSFAMEHARRHGLRRIVYVIPFTSVIEQTAEVFRRALAAEPGGENRDDILEHHSGFDWAAAGARTGEDGRGAQPAERLRRAAENWDAPVVVTTAVQFFESLFANRTSRCRKLHNLAGSVIVLDEAQTMPLHLLSPCLAALDELQRNYGASVVLCTATQPAIRVEDGFRLGLDIPADRELAPDPARLSERLRRAEVEFRATPVTDAEIAARFAEQPGMLCVVNRRDHAQALFAAIRHLPGAVHLSTLMCPRHRRAVLAGARARLKAGEPVRIVSTSLIEAGVDIDLPEVWRAAAGLDSIVQAAGRCNREGRLPHPGRVVVFEPADARAPHSIAQAWDAGRPLLRDGIDPLSPDAHRRFFKRLYHDRGPEELDRARLDGQDRSILALIAEGAPRTGETAPALNVPFETIARAFRVIDETMETVVVPWADGPDDTEAADLLARVGAPGRPLQDDLRRLQPYGVAIPQRARAVWLAAGVLVPVCDTLGEALLRVRDLEHYDPAMGLRVDAPMLRAADDNIL